MRLPNKQSLRQLAFVKWIKKLVNSNGFISFVAKFIASAVITIFMFIPAYFYLIVRWLLSPEGFWQEFAIFVVACLVIGWLQVIMLIFGCILILMIVLEDF